MTNVEVRRVDLANWALWSSPKFTTGLNISSIRVFDQMRDPEIPITLRPPVSTFQVKFKELLGAVHLYPSSVYATDYQPISRYWIRGSRVETRLGSMDFFISVKILSMTSFGREVKPWVPCRRFTARKRTSSRN